MLCMEKPNEVFYCFPNIKNRLWGGGAEVKTYNSKT